jgi:predicted Rossmann-fold nucleotide-binding protein
MPRIPISFEPFRRAMYSRHELFAGFDSDDPDSFAKTRDFDIYREYIVSGKYAPQDFFVAMMQAMHDNAVTQAMRDFLDEAKARPIGVMGGHKLSRASAAYRSVVALSRELSRRGFTMLSGGGPGAMEATHLGATLCRASDDAVTAALEALATQPTVPDLSRLIEPDGSVNAAPLRAAHAWFAPAHVIAVAATDPAPSLAVPTWLYGHEPTTALATHVAKYFQNSIREDGLLAVATNGVVYVEGRAGTLQEIFQDAAQNYYRTFGTFSPMVFLGSSYWSTTVPAIPVLHALFAPDDFAQFVLITDSVAEAADFLESHGTAENAAERIDRYLSHETRRRESP